VTYGRSDLRSGFDFAPVAATSPHTDRLPEIRTREVPGPRSRALAERLAKAECPEVTSQTPAPIFWESAAGANVVDVDQNTYVDLLAGFGVVALGYAHPRVSEAIAAQTRQLPHAMGDVYPAAIKVDLLERLSEILPGGLGLGILSSSGSDAIESALKTAILATGRAEVLAFEGGYHGLGFGALDATHRSDFRTPFRDRLAHRTHFAPFGDAAATRRLAHEIRPGAILFEPVQGRGGLRLPPPGFLAELRKIANEVDALLVADEIYTGLGRTGRWLACDHWGVEPDVVALGKALGSGFPISACLGKRECMTAWPSSNGEAVHTSTHLGNPQGCAAGLAVLAELEANALPERAFVLGAEALARLEQRLSTSPHVVSVRGLGLLLGIELDSGERARAIVRSALESGWIVLGEGPGGNVLTLTPPLTIDADVLAHAIDRLAEWIDR